MSAPEREAWVQTLRAHAPDLASRLDTALAAHRSLSEQAFWTRRRRCRQRNRREADE